jgi:hypothetical protein
MPNQIAVVTELERLAEIDAGRPVRDVFDGYLAAVEHIHSLDGV